MKPIKVLEIIRQGEIGGGESHLLDLISGFSRNEVEPVVMAFTDGHMIEVLKSQGVRCYVVTTQRAFDLRVCRTITRILKEERIQIVHAHGSRAAANILLPAKYLGLPLIYTVHGWSFHQDQPRWVYKLRVWSEKLICRCSRQVICVSENNRQAGMDVFELSDNCHVIENGINLTLFNPDRKLKDIRLELGIPQKEFIIGFIGRVTRQKAPMDFIKSIVAAHAQDNDIKGLLIGDGDMKQEVEDYIRQEKAEDFFYLSGFRTDIPDLLNAIDVFCLPSLWEGLSISLLEAMAMKKAVVVTPTDGTREIIRDHHNGLIVSYSQVSELTKAYLEYKNDTILKDKCGENAFRLVKTRFDCKRVSNEVINIYKGLAKCQN